MGAASAEARAAGESLGPEIDAVVLAHLAAALRIIDAAVARLPDGAEVDEARCLDRAVEAIRRAVRTHDPARGPLDRWCAVLVWQAVRKATAPARRNARRAVPIEEAGKPDAPDPRAETALNRVEASCAIATWAANPTKPLLIGAGALRRLARRRGRARA